MLVIQPAKRNARRAAKARTSRHRVGLAIAGGGPIGGMYELGALRALDEALDGIDLTRLDVYVGVSSGAFLAAGLANGISTEEMCRIFITGESRQVKFRPEDFLRPAFYEYVRRVAAVPRIMMGWLSDLATKPFEANWSTLLGRLGALVPAGLFDNAEVERFLREVFDTQGRSNDFRKLARKLYVVAVELDTGATVRFGAPGHDHVPISRAVQASAALPGLYPPVEVDGKHYVDGALRRTLHASVAMDEGVDIVLGLNPLVPFDASLATQRGRRVPQRLADAGLPSVLSQTFRTLLKSRMQVGLDKYQVQYANTDLVLFEPNADDAEMFFTNIFSYHSRQRLTEHAYRATLDDLRERRAEIEPILQRNGIRLRDEVVNDRQRSLLSSLGLKRTSPSTRPTARLRLALDDLEATIAARASKPSTRRAAPRKPRPSKPTARRAR
jgi:predicted acylesterase/phospholipase RssA